MSSSKSWATLSPLAGTLAACVTGHRQQKVPLATLREHAYAAHPTLHTDLHARAVLRAAMDELVGAGVMKLPASGSKTGWDTAMIPPLPIWVTKAASATAVEPPTSPVRRAVYPSALEQAASYASRDEEYMLLNTIADWLRQNPRPLLVPLEERSLELFDDEKALGAKLTNRLFTTGALTLELLGCRRTPMPLPSQHIPGSGPTLLLVCENRAAYYSMITATRALPAPERPDLHVAFGGGNQFSVGHAEIAFLDPVPARLLYCGDLDVAGIKIAQRAAVETPSLTPAVTHYEWMLTHGVRQRDRSNRGQIDMEPMLDWFPRPFREPVRELLATRTKISQETIGLDALTEHPELITTL